MKFLAKIDNFSDQPTNGKVTEESSYWWYSHWGKKKHGTCWGNKKSGPVKHKIWF